MSDELQQRRTAMGKGTLAWITSPEMVGEVDERRWLLLSGAPSPDMNFVLMQVADEQLLRESIAEVERRDLQALVMLAGEGKALADRVPPAFSEVGEMPIMSKSLTGTAAAKDPRVRRATAADRDTVNELLMQAYGMAAEVVQVATAPLLREGEDSVAIWLLEDGDQSVSTVTVLRHEDLISLWCMATPPQQQRKGYGRVLLESVLGEAQRSGAAVGVLGATPAGYPLYEATGWKTDETFALYVNATSEQFS